MTVPSLFIASSRLPFPAAGVLAWHARAGAAERLRPPWAEAMPEGEPLLPGRFTRWRHTQEGLDDGHGCLLRDRVEHASRGGALGRARGPASLEHRLAALFAYRHLRVARDLALHAAARSAGPLRVAITGASGLLGSALHALLTTGGHEVKRLVRRRAERADEISWRPDAGEIELGSLEGLDAVVHLAGESLAAGRWTEARKRSIRDSRVGATTTLARALARLERPPRVLVSASGANVYGTRSDTPADEATPPGDDFLARLCVDWEGAARPASERGVRVVHPRFGAVLSPRGGMLQKMRPAFALGLGGRIGGGRQGLAWVSIEDAVAVLHRMIVDDRLVGPVNVVAPELSTNAAFVRALADVLGRPALLPLPSAVVRAAFGEMGETLLLEGALARPARLEAIGFSFTHPTLRPALEELLGRAPVPRLRREGAATHLEL